MNCYFAKVKHQRRKDGVSKCVTRDSLTFSICDWLCIGKSIQMTFTDKEVNIMKSCWFGKDRLVINEPLLLHLNNLSHWKVYGCFFQFATSRKLEPSAVWPDWVIYWTLGNFLKPLATIHLPKSPTFLGNFVKMSKYILFPVKSFLCNCYRHSSIFSGHTGRQWILGFTFQNIDFLQLKRKRTQKHCLSCGKLSVRGFSHFAKKAETFRSIKNSIQNQLDKPKQLLPMNAMLNFLFFSRSASRSKL